MKTLGIDFGTKRVGVAVSDETKTFARELAIIDSNKFFKDIQLIIKQNEIEEIVVGLPLNMDGVDSEKTKEVREFADLLKAETNLPVILVDERLSTVMAGNLPGGQIKKDSLAAQIILQNYLDQTKSKK